MDDEIRELQRAGENGDQTAVSKLMGIRLRTGYYVAEMRGMVAELGPPKPRAPDMVLIQHALLFFEGWQLMIFGKSLHDVLCDLTELAYTIATQATRAQREEFLDLIEEYNEAALGLHLT